MTVSDSEPPETPPKQGRIALAAAVFLASSVWFAIGVAQEPAFPDEWAYISQAYFGPLWWDGRWHDPAWLDYQAIDLPPLPKYLIASALRLAGSDLPTRADASRWYQDISTSFGDQGMLIAARVPSALMGGLGCAALFGLGSIAFGARSGLLAALLLAMNPLYALHARRAMSDVPTEAFTLLTLAVGLWAWTRIAENRASWRSTLAWTIGGGVFGGLAVLSKLSGGLALMTLAAWVGLMTVHGWRKAARLAALTVWTGLIAYATFALGNPALIADPTGSGTGAEATGAIAEFSPIERTFLILNHRATVSEAGREKFPHHALETIADKCRVVAVQGFGRFGPLGPARTDSTKRYDFKQDWGALVWGPLVLLGLGAAIVDGRRRRRNGRAATPWAVVAQWFVALGTVTLFIPLAWDRYQLPIQAPAALLAAGLLGGWAASIGRALGLGGGS